MKTIHVVAAVIKNNDDQILIAKRPKHVHQGRLWEFPGGKVEAGESPELALQRELNEELGIAVSDSKPLIQIVHHYPDKSVFLDVKYVTTFNGTATGNEGQKIQWVDKCQLHDFDFPAANIPIIDAIQLPQQYLITPEHTLNEREIFLTHLEKKLQNGVTLVQLRAKSLSTTELFTLYEQVNKLTLQFDDAILCVNTTIENAIEFGVNNVHLSSRELVNTQSLPENLYVSASCHNQAEINKANQLGIKFIVLAPVKFTNSHPDAIPLGWENFQELCKKAVMPVFALGGMNKSDTSTAASHGAQGIAAISGLW